MKLVRIFAALIFLPSAAICDDYAEDLGDLISEARNNPVTASAFWLEGRNGFGEWEKVALVFGYISPTNEDACDEMRDSAMEKNPRATYRCNPVD